MLTQTIFSALLALVLSAAGADTRLPDAAMQGDRIAVQSLLKEKVDINSAQGDGNTALHWAVMKDDLAMADLLLKAGADVKLKTRLGEMTPLFFAAKSGNPAMIGLLLKAGSDANTASTNGTTPLMLAAASGKADAVKVLLDNGAQVNAKDVTNGQTALMFAAAQNRDAVIQLLAERGADLNILTKVSDIPKFGGRDGDEGRRMEVERMGGNSALHFAAREGHLQAARALVAAKADVNIGSASDGLPAVTQAIINGHFDLAKYLLESGANPNVASKTGLTPLYAAIDSKFAQRTWYPPPLGAVEQAKTSYLDLMKALIDKGADVNARLGRKLWFRSFGNSGGPDTAGATAFWRAAQAHDMEAMKLLLASGADPNIATTKGSTALQVAAGMHWSQQGSNVVPNGRMTTIKFLVEELKADVNSKDDKGYSVLHGAALAGQNDIIEYLVAKGADPKARANQVSGSGDGGGTAIPVEPGKGDTVADMANGWSMNAVQYAETVRLLITLGSEFSNTCWASTCVNPTRPDKKGSNQ